MALCCCRAPKRDEELTAELLDSDTPELPSTGVGQDCVSGEVDSSNVEPTHEQDTTPTIVDVTQRDCVSKEVREAMDRFLDTVVRYKCVDRAILVSHWRVTQAIRERLYQKGLVAQQVHYTGSRYEGMPQDVCNDLDAMFTDVIFPVVLLEPPGDSKKHQSGFAVARGNTDQPAYLRLKVTDMEGVGQEIRDITEDDGFLNSRKFVDMVKGDKDETHGPATINLAVPSHPKFGMSDLVACFYSPTLPPCGLHFLSRPRPHGWPSQSLIDKIQQAGCHVVGVGHPHSDNKDTEWRWSFSLAEKELIHNFTDTMYQCMYVLKAVMKKHRISDDHIHGGIKPFCSYYLKTACLWTFEASLSHKASAITLCNHVLEWLMSCYHDSRLPHYFMPEQNLIGHLSHANSKKVHDWLWKVRSDIWWMILSSVKMTRHLQNVIDNMCRQLQVSPVSPDCDYRELVSTLCVHDRAREMLEGAIDAIKPSSKWYRDLQRHYTGFRSSGTNNDIFQALESQWNESSPSYIITIPDTVLLPIINNMHSVVKDGYGDMFSQILYRHLGDLYLSILCYMHRTDIAIRDYYTNYDKAVHYYTLGREMVHPDGWSDKGLVGDVLLAKLYYLSGHWSQLEGHLVKLKSRLGQVSESGDDVYGQALIRVSLLSSVSVYPWKSDMEMYTQVISTWDDIEVFFHPVPLGYYILARFALRQGNREAALIALHNIKRSVDNKWCANHKKSTRSLIAILIKLLGIDTL